MLRPLSVRTKVFVPFLSLFMGIVVILVFECFWDVLWRFIWSLWTTKHCILLDPSLQSNFFLNKRQNAQRKPMRSSIAQDSTKFISNRQWKRVTEGEGGQTRIIKTRRIIQTNLCPENREHPMLFASGWSQKEDCGVTANWRRASSMNSVLSCGHICTDVILPCIYRLWC